MSSLAQDPTDPTGVADHTPRGNSEVNRARIRKAEAALAMRAEGHDWDLVASTLGYPTGDIAQAAVENTLAHMLDRPEHKAYLRSLAHTRLENLLAAVYPGALDPDQPGQLAMHDAARATIRDDMNLLGYKAPTEFTVNNPSTAAIEAWVARVTSLEVSDVAERDIFEMVEGPDGVYEQVEHFQVPEKTGKDT